MIQFLVKHLIADYKNTQDLTVRNRYGNFSSIIGFIVNALLVLSKATIGIVIGSVSVVADAINNLTDMGNLVLMYLSFKLSSRPADNEHPFGHARYEYLFSNILAVMIVVVGVQLIIESIKNILNPKMIEFNWVAVIVLILSILLKFWLSRVYQYLSNRIDSSLLLAFAQDSLSDTWSTTAVLLSLMLSPLLGFSLDGYMGVLVGFLILQSGWQIIKDATSHMIGKEADPQLIETITNKVLAYQGVFNMHDLIIHDYGPHQKFASLHVEVDARMGILKAHELVDRIEKAINSELQIQTVIHMDPLILDDPLTKEYYHKVKKITYRLNPKYHLHDFHLEQKENALKLIFEVELPANETLTNEAIFELYDHHLKQLSESIVADITLDRHNLFQRQVL